jgi:predicted TIM-barrel fold metal-dependent hydrolase
MTYRLISSDSHADAPPEIYLENVPAKFHDCIPHFAKGDDGKNYLVVRGQRVLTMEDHNEGRAGGPWQEVREFDMNDPDVWKPERRLEHLDRDDVAAEVIQGGATWVLFDRDPEAQMAVCRVWNDWAMDVYKPYQSRIQPSATLPIADIPGACKEAQRLAAMGYTNVQMPINPVEMPYRKRVYDPLWAVLQETGLTVNLHIRSGTRKSTPFSAGRVYNYCVDCTDGIITAADLCSTGVLERFPGLRFVFLEVGGGWAAWLMHTMDGIYFAHPETSITLKKLPSEYFKQSMHCSIMMDSVAMQTLDTLPADNLIFSTDYPHPEGTWPESQRRVAMQVKGWKQEDIEKFTHKNAERLYGFPETMPSTAELLRTA